MKERYRRWMHNWESRMTSRDNNRVVRPFEWGLDWTASWPGLGTLGAVPDTSNHDAMVQDTPPSTITWQRTATSSSRTKPKDFRIEHRKVELFHTGSQPPKKQPKDEIGKFLRFTSPVTSPFPENNLVNARWFPAQGHRAVVLLPQWNADGVSQNALSASSTCSASPLSG